MPTKLNTQGFLEVLKNNHGDDNPFVLEGSNVFMRYDEIRITQSSPSEITSKFFWKGAHTYTINMPRPYIAEDGELRLRLTEGRMKFETTT